MYEYFIRLYSFPAIPPGLRPSFSHGQNDKKRVCHNSSYNAHVSLWGTRFCRTSHKNGVAACNTLFIKFPAPHMELDLFIACQWTIERGRNAMLPCRMVFAFSPSERFCDTLRAIKKLRAGDTKSPPRSFYTFFKSPDCRIILHKAA